MITVSGLPDGLLFNALCPWDMLDGLKSWFARLDEQKRSTSAILSKSSSISGDVWIGDGARILDYSVIDGPVFIGKNTIIGPHAYIRSFAVIGDGVHIGHCTEVKNSVVGTRTKAAHFAYIGDSVVGANVNLGGGVRLANLRFDRGEIKVGLPDGKLVNSGRKKLGAIIGDNVQLGVNVITMPGTIIESGAVVMPGEIVKGNKYGY